MFKAISMFFEFLFNLLESGNNFAKAGNICSKTCIHMAKGFDKEKRLEQKLKNIAFDKKLAKAKLENKELDTSDFDDSIDEADKEIESNKESQDSK